MSRIPTPEPDSRQEQFVLFRSTSPPQNGFEVMTALRVENLKLVVAAGWRKSAGIVCMVGGCYVPLEIWTRRKKGKPLERKYLERDTLMLHEHSNERRSDGK
jgi:hypothetical protein